ncbi:hypothetical protein [Halorussus halophilus]|uniref:hypothetical protein n=1 Tax=Halorussus halophilus TaxID=2650975 RepID=UPI00130195AF|nr:hypothetical protein [Halorussus halophilus]
MQTEELEHADSDRTEPDERTESSDGIESNERIDSNERIEPTDGDGGFASPEGDESPTEPGDSFDPQSEGKAEAKRILTAVEGDTEAARAETALARKRESVEQLNQQLAETQRRRRETNDRINALEYTAERIASADDDQLVMQHLEGGISTSVPADEREDVREQLGERVRRLEQRLEGIDGRVEGLERAIEKDRIALEHLRNHRDLVSDQ